MHTCAWHVHMQIILRIALSSMRERLIAVYAARKSCYSYDIGNCPVIVVLERKQYSCSKKNFWLASYFCKRVHRVPLASYSASLLPVKSGIPQGSILRPLLFLVYVSNIFTAVSPSCLFLFANDTQYLRLVDCFSDCLPYNKT